MTKLQKIIKVGNSAAVTINKDTLEELGFCVGDFVEVTSYPKAKKLAVETIKTKSKVKEIIDPKVYKTAANLLKRYLPAFRKLANIK